jgi:hypothetical protein
MMADVSELAVAVSLEENNMSVGDVLIAFGEWWIIKTTSEKISWFNDSGGDNLREIF